MEFRRAVTAAHFVNNSSQKIMLLIRMLTSGSKVQDSKYCIGLPRTLQCTRSSWKLPAFQAVWSSKMQYNNGKTLWYVVLARRFVHEVNEMKAHRDGSICPSVRFNFRIASAHYGTEGYPKLILITVTIMNMTDARTCKVGMPLNEEPFSYTGCLKRSFTMIFQCCCVASDSLYAFKCKRFLLTLATQ
jgi:hypothetical protein